MSGHSVHLIGNTLEEDYYKSTRPFGLIYVMLVSPSW